MHVIFFGLKRAFHGALRVTRDALAILGLTPARFDMLYIVAKEGSSLLQRDLQRALGVAAATVSRMLKSLEELGLIEREVTEEDHRCRNVMLTKEGRPQGGALARSRGASPADRSTARSPVPWYDPMRAAGGATSPIGTLHFLRDAYGDVATLHYPRGHVRGFERFAGVWRGPSESGY